MKAKNLVCFSGKTFAERTFSGVVVNGRWLEPDELPFSVKRKLELEYRKLYPTWDDAPVDVVTNDDENGEEISDFYYPF